MVERFQQESKELHTPQRRWVWCSHSGTADEGIFSVLAAVEVIIAVAAYWGYAFWAHTIAHLLFTAIAAPLLLLRSDASIRTGAKFFGLFNDWLIKHDERHNLRGPINREIWKKAYLTILVLSGLMFAFLVRMVAIIMHPFAGLTSLSSNWWRTLFATDIFTKPEIVPGYNNQEGPYSVEVIYRDALSPDFENKNIGYRLLNGIGLIIGAPLVLLVTLGPSYFYRMSIKSTAWIHWPLAYIARPRKISEDVEEVRLRLWADPREWLLRFFMLLTFAGALVASLPSLAHVKDVFPNGVVSLIEYAFLIDVKTLFAHPWRVVALCSAAITLFLTWYGWELSLLVARSSARIDRAAKAMMWAAALEYAMRVRTVCGWIFWALVLVHAGLWLAPSTDWMPDYPREILQTIYGEFLPPNLRY